MTQTGTDKTGTDQTDNKRTGFDPAAVDAAITLGPVLFNWDADRLTDFYAAVADETSADLVIVGEAVCSKREKRRPDFWPHIIARLERAGKKVAMSTLALITANAEADALSDMLRSDEDRLFEANEFTGHWMLRGRPHVVGPFVNVYNEMTLSYFVEGGAQQICLPVETPREVAAELAPHSPVPLEMFVLGRAPLAISARCFTARAVGRGKQGCRFACLDAQDGMTVKTLEGEDFLTLNGPQTLSHGCYNLVDRIPELMQMGIRRFRVSPDQGDMVGALNMLRSVIDGKLAPDAATRQLDGALADAPNINGFYHGEPGRNWVAV